MFLSRRFTLVELIVVCTIVLILTTLSISAIAKVMRYSKYIACTNTLSQINIASQIYSDTSMEFVLPSCNNDKYWFQALSENSPELFWRRNKINHLRFPAVPLCPASYSEIDQCMRVGAFTKYQPWRDGEVNPFLGGFSRWHSTGGFWTAAKISFPPQKISQIYNPSVKIMLFDGFCAVLNLNSQFDNSPENGGTAWRRHSTNTINASFADGHVAPFNRRYMNQPFNNSTVKKYFFTLDAR